MFKVLQLQVYLRIDVGYLQISLLTDHIQVHSNPKSVMVSSLWLFFFHDLHVLKSSLRHCIWILWMVLVESQNRWGLEFILVFCTSWSWSWIIIIRGRHPSSITQVYFTSEVFNNHRSHWHSSTADSRFRIHPIVDRNEFFSIGRCHNCADTSPSISQLSSSLMILPTHSHFCLSLLLICISSQAL